MYTKAKISQYRAELLSEMEVFFSPGNDELLY